MTNKNPQRGARKKGMVSARENWKRRGTLGRVASSGMALGDMERLRRCFSEISGISILLNTQKGEKMERILLERRSMESRGFLCPNRNVAIATI